MSRCQQRLPTGRTENFVRAIFYIFNSIKGNDFGKKGPMMLLKSLNYAIDSIQGEKFSLNFSRELENFLKNCSKWKIFDQFLDRFLENLRRWNYVSLCERRKKRNSNRWMDEIISRNNRLQSYQDCYQRFFKKLLSPLSTIGRKKKTFL